MIRASAIAGQDASGGAGLEADLKTFEEYGVYGSVAVTAIATMDPENNWSHKVFPVAEDALKAQLETIFKGVSPNAVKTGMLGSDYAVRLSREYLEKFGVKNFVFDPVMVCKGAGEALNPALNARLEKELLPLAAVVTPNLFEAGELSGIKNIDSLEKMKSAAEILFKKGARSVFVKGGSKLPNPKKALDIFFDGKEFTVVEAPLIETNWTHGSGCTVAAAICAGLARGLSVKDAVILAKSFVTESLSASFALNKWVGPGNPSHWRGSFGAR